MRIAAYIASIAFALALAAPAAADRGDGGAPSKSSSISLVTPPGADESWPSHGDTVEFAVATTQTDKPYVNLRCHQGAELVADGWASYFGAGLAHPGFGLSTPSWTAGAADCTATLTMWFNGRNKQLASTSFHVGA